MAITAYNTTYCDDVNVPDSNGKTPLDKNYMRILFKPGYAVQTRELNQLQSLIQAQLDRLGDSIYQSGKPVIDGSARFDDQLEIYSVDVTTSTPLIDLDENLTDDVFDFTSYNRVTRTTVGVSNDSPLRAKVVIVEPLEPPIIDGQYRYKLFLKNTNSETSATQTNISKYSVGDSLSLDNSQDDTVVSISLNVTAVHSSVGAQVAKGVYFIKGCYVPVDEQYVATDVPADSKFTGYAVLKVTEGIASAEDPNSLARDNSLLDNARGYLNYSAAGADRYYINLTLELLSGTDIPTDEKYITLLKIVDDKVMVNYAEAEFTGIDDKLAKRTYEESGNYEVNPFPIHIREAYNDLTNGGLYTNAELIENGYSNAAAAQEDLICTLDPSVAYVKGYRVQLNSAIPLKFSKARETDSLQNVGISADMGMYVDGIFDSGSNIPNIENVETIYTLKSGTYGAASIGTTRIRSIESNGDGTYRLFLYDTRFTGTSEDHTIRADTKIVLGNSITFISDTVLKDADVRTALYDLPFSPIKNIADVQIIKKKVFDGVAIVKTNPSNTVGTLTVSLTDTSSVFDKSLSNIIVCVNGTMIIPQSNITLVTSDSSTLTLSLSGLPTGSVTARVIASVTSTAKRGNKILKTTARTITPAPTGVYTLTGIKHLVSVSGTTTATYEIISDGQKDAHYEDATIKITKTTTGDTTPVTLTVKYYDFDTSDAVYYDALSYKEMVVSGGITSTVQIPLEDIPSYNGTPLIDVLDFRYVLGASQFSPIDAYSPITFDLEYYIPRIDSVVVNNIGEFSILKGVASTEPKKRSIPSNAMELYTLNIGPYTFGPDDVDIEKIDNKRYTMSNIRSLERRISNLEYYTTLSLLEKNANDTTILDEFGINNRFKNGFVVDNFIGHNVSDTTEGNSVCAVDPDTNECRPAFSTRSLKFKASNIAQVEPEGWSSGVHDRAITLPYKPLAYITQSAASESRSIVPLDSATTVGKLNLYPSADYWCETNEIKPNVVQNDSLKDSFVNVITGLEDELDVDILGTEWNSWTAYWKGKLLRKYKKKTRRKIKKYRANQIEYRRDGLTTSVGADNTTVDLGERVVDLSVRPYIRRRYIYFSAKALKANTVYYPFFDGVDVGFTCYNLTEAEFDERKNTDIVGPYLPEIAPGSKTQIKSDEDGELFGVFVVPDFTKSGLRFLTGEREFKLSDSPRNSSPEITSYASTNYVASGMTKTVQSAILSTAVPELVRTPVSEVRINKVTRSISNLFGKCGYQDPIAQSFLIDNDEGIFAAGIDLFFAKKSSTNTPVEIYIVACENGMPTQNVVPLSTVIKKAADVIVSDNELPGLPTHFEFEQPVYLSPYQEYAVVCKSTDADYKVFTATLGQPNIADDGQTISKNPYGGVFFVSANSSTWTPEQTVDLTFTLYRAQFDTNSQKEVVFNTPSVQTLRRIQVTNAGAGYTSVPTVTIDGSATAYAVLNSNNGIAEIVITNQGEDYTNIPTVVIAAPPSGGTQATAIAVMANHQVSNFVLDQDTVELAISADIKTSVTNQITIIGNNYKVEADTTYEAYKSKKAWSDDEDGVNRNNLVELTSTLYTTSDYITPVIDTDRLNVKLIRNNIQTDKAKTSRYVTRDIQLAEKADQIDIYFDVNRPSTACDLNVYVKYDDGGDWITVPILNPRIIPVNTDPDTFSEIHYQIKSAPSEFGSFRVKIEFVSTNIVDVPRVKNFRAIATT
jgi:hypothetical protein